MKSTTVSLSLSLCCLLAPACDSAKDASADPGKANPEPASAKAAPKAPEPDRYGGEFCATIIPCFQQLKFSGSFTAEVTVDIEPDGSVSAVSFAGEAPVPVQACITDTIKGITLASYNGKPGRTHCTQGGQLMGGTQMVSSGMTYQVRSAEPSPEAKAALGVAPTPGAEPAPGADAAPPQP